MRSGENVGIERAVGIGLERNAAHICRIAGELQRGQRRHRLGRLHACSAQRTPINSESKLLLLAHAFEAMDCVCVQFRTDHFNFASQRAIERLGAKRDGLIRNHQILDGRVRDTVLYSILASEWEGVKRNLLFRLGRA